MTPLARAQRTHLTRVTTLAAAALAATLLLPSTHGTPHPADTSTSRPGAAGEQGPGNSRTGS